jgi:hypothetical protein
MSSLFKGSRSTGAADVSASPISGSREISPRPDKASTSPKSEQKAESNTPNVNLVVANLSIDLLSRMIEKCTITATGTGSADEKLKHSCWRFWQDDNKKYHVNVPSNLEQLADNWIAILGVIAADRLGAEIHISSDPMEEILYEGYEQYLHGIGSVLRQGTNVKFQKASGKYLQGYGWASSQCEFVQKHKEWFRVNYESPLVFLTGKKVWNKMPGGDKQRWYNLVIRAAQTVKLENPLEFTLSHNELCKVFVKQQWSWHNGAVFTNIEMNEMSSYISQEEKKYNDYINLLKNPTINLIERFKYELAEISQPVHKYDLIVRNIATKRASVLYSQKMRKRYRKGALSLEERLSLLDASDHIMCTNPTGLLPLMDRHPMMIRSNKDIESILPVLRKVAHEAESRGDKLSHNWALSEEVYIKTYLGDDEPEDLV